MRIHPLDTGKMRNSLLIVLILASTACGSVRSVSPKLENVVFRVAEYFAGDRTKIFVKSNIDISDTGKFQSVTNRPRHFRKDEVYIEVMLNSGTSTGEVCWFENDGESGLAAGFIYGSALLRMGPLPAMEIKGSVRLAGNGWWHPQQDAPGHDSPGRLGLRCNPASAKRLAPVPPGFLPLVGAPSACGESSPTARRSAAGWSMVPACWSGLDPRRGTCPTRNSEGPKDGGMKCATRKQTRDD